MVIGPRSKGESLRSALDLFLYSELMIFLRMKDVAGDKVSCT